VFHLYRMLAISIVLLCAVFVSADETQDVFNTVYGARLQAVESTPDPADDVEYARTLLDAARESRDTPDLLKLLCETSERLGSRNKTGFRIAVEATRLQMEVIPGVRGTCLNRILELQQAIWRSSQGAAKTDAALNLFNTLLTNAEYRINEGEYAKAIKLYRQSLPLARSLRSPLVSDIISAREATAIKLQTNNRIQGLHDELKRDPKDSDLAEQLVKALVVEADDPTRAAKFTFLPLTDELKNHVKLAAQPVDNLEPSQAANLGDWYYGLANQSSESTRTRLLIRARNYYRRCQQAGNLENLEQKKTELVLKQINDTLDKVGANSNDAMISNDVVKRRMWAWDFDEPGDLDDFDIDGDHILREGGGLEFPNGKPRSSAMTRLKFSPPMVVELQVYCLPNGTLDIFPGVPNLMRLGWGANYNKITTVAVGNTKKKIRHLPIIRFPLDPRAR